MKSNVVLWVIQILFGVYFIFVGIMHFVVPDGLPSAMEWMYDLSDNLHYVAGTAEILGGIGLILPGLVKVRTELTAYAAFGLVIVMIGAAIWHLGRDGEVQNIVTNVVIAAVMAWVGYARLRLTPLEGR